MSAAAPRGVGGVVATMTVKRLLCAAKMGKWRACTNCTAGLEFKSVTNDKCGTFVRYKNGTSL